MGPEMKKQNLAKTDRTSIRKRLGMCAAAIGGTAALAPDAHAAIVTFNTPIPIPNTFAGVYVNLTDGTSGSSSALTGWDFNPYGASSLTQIGFFWNSTAPAAGGVASTATGPYLDLSPGAVVGPASTYSNVILGTNSSPFITPGTHILGVRFANDTSGVTNYGYVSITTSVAGGIPAVIDGWSYDDTGAAITVAPVPEPSTLLLTTFAMAVGARGLRKWRRKQAVA